jgi:hypothetical protein
MAKSVQETIKGTEEFLKDHPELITQQDIHNHRMAQSAKGRAEFLRQSYPDLHSVVEIIGKAKADGFFLDFDENFSLAIWGRLTALMNRNA